MTTKQVGLVQFAVRCPSMRNFSSSAEDEEPVHKPAPPAPEAEEAQLAAGIIPGMQQVGEVRSNAMRVHP